MTIATAADHSRRGAIVFPMPRVTRSRLTPALAAAAVIGVIALTPIMAGGRVLGADDRRAPGVEEAQLLRAIGLVFCSRVVDERRRVGAGTGTIVGSRDTILTAAHIFTEPAGRQGPQVEFDPVADCTFRRYDAFGNPAVETGFSHASLGAYRGSGNNPNQDWAVLRTEEPLPAATSEPLPFPRIRPTTADLAGLEILMLAFHRDVRDRNRVPMLSEGRLLDVDYGGFPRLAHTADMERMSSGAAIVYRTRDGANIVVAINRSAANLADFNLAVPLSFELLEALRSFAYGQVPLRRQWLAEQGT
jgi:hypothetical protein